ncbi:MAG: hypothetical protein AAFZ52_10510 [Bacteroidota bacterium]
MAQSITEDFWPLHEKMYRQEKSEQWDSLLQSFHTLETYNVKMIAGTYRVASTACFQLGDTDLAKHYYYAALDRGLHHYEREFGDMEKEEADITAKFGPDFWVKAVERGKDALAPERQRSQIITDRLVKVIWDDVALRRNNKYRTCRNYGHTYRYVPNRHQYDSLGHDSLIVCYEEFRRLDSTNLLPFIHFVDSVGFIPSMDFFGGKLGFTTLIVHSSAYQFPVDLHTIFRRSINLGTLDPFIYAWYYGYGADMKRWPHKYYWTIRTPGAKQDLQNSINAARAEFGLRPWPWTMWDR